MLAEETARPPDHLPIGYLRVFAVLLVLAHHAVLAYHPQAPDPPTSLIDQPRWWQAFPVLDTARSDLVPLFVGWNDIFFMALLFLLSGLFVAGSLGRHGARRFFARRLRRLGLPFLGLAAIIAPLAYYPAYLATADPDGVAGYARVWLALGNWPAGPGWFLWMLLLFGAVIAALFARRPGWIAEMADASEGLTARPFAFFSVLVAGTALVYVPASFAFGYQHWTAVGPFAFQTSRFFFYAAYFLAGVVLGAQGLDRGLLASDGRLSRRWALWVSAAPGAFAFAAGAFLATFAPGAGAAVRAIAAFGFVVCCAASCLALLALFLRFVRRARPVLESLRANSYGMYVVHYVFASWLQYALLPAELPALAKATAVVAATILLSWATTAALRLVPAVRRVL